MDNFRPHLEQSVERDLNFFQTFLDATAVLRQQSEGFFDVIRSRIEQFRKSGIASKKGSSARSSLKENESSNANVKKEVASPLEKRNRRVLRENLVESPVILQAENAKVRVKKEKVSIGNKRTASLERMPPPLLPLKKPIKTETTRRPRTRARKAEIEENSAEPSRKDSDVILNSNSIVTVELTSDEDETINSIHKEDIAPVRSTRTKTKVKRIRSSSEEGSDKPEEKSKLETSKSKRIKHKKAQLENKSSSNSVYEDALTDASMNNTESIPQVADRVTAPLPTLDHTYVTAPTVEAIFKDIMTEDEESPVRSPPKKAFNKVEKNAKQKQLFSPFEASPVKKKVAAFEKLGAEAVSDLPMRVTRTKTKAKAAEKENDIEGDEIQQPKNFTPVAENKVLPSFTSHSVSKLQTSKSIEYSQIPKCYTSIKSSQAEYRERELRRQKEADAIKKKEALVQAQMEERRRKREEKQMKAQQQREALEREKQKRLQYEERLKVEKLKHALAEKEQKQAKIREDNERKRLLIKKRALEEKQKETNKEEKTPIYMIMKAPVLPTSDCYDSDDERPNTTVTYPSWTRRNQFMLAQQSAFIILEKFKNTFFCRAAQTPDLVDIFKKIDPKKLKRTSSAVWHKPPRFTLASGLETTIERNDSSEED